MATWEETAFLPHKSPSRTDKGLLFLRAINCLFLQKPFRPDVRGQKILEFLEELPLRKGGAEMKKMMAFDQETEFFSGQGMDKIVVLRLKEGLFVKLTDLEAK